MSRTPLSTDSTSAPARFPQRSRTRLTAAATAGSRTRHRHLSSALSRPIATSPTRAARGPAQRDDARQPATERGKSAR